MKYSNYILFFSIFFDFFNLNSLLFISFYVFLFYFLFICRKLYSDSVFFLFLRIGIEPIDSQSISESDGIEKLDSCRIMESERIGKTDSDSNRFRFYNTDLIIFLILNLGQIHFDKLFNFTCSADLGLSFEDDTCLAYRYALPNKIFDYINAEIPVLVSDLPEYRHVINKYNVGCVLKSRKPKFVAQQINKMLLKSKKDW